MRRFALVAAAALALPGCASKDFGRMQMAPVTGLSCEQLAAEQGKVDEFRAAIDQKDDFDMRTVSAVWMDFGYGNMRDKKQALKSADAREAQLAEARQAQGCTAA